MDRLDAVGHQLRPLGPLRLEAPGTARSPHPTTRRTRSPRARRPRSAGCSLRARPSRRAPCAARSSSSVSTLKRVIARHPPSPRSTSTPASRSTPCCSYWAADSPSSRAMPASASLDLCRTTVPFRPPGGTTADAGPDSTIARPGSPPWRRTRERVRELAATRAWARAPASRTASVTRLGYQSCHRPDQCGSAKGLSGGTRWRRWSRTRRSSRRPSTAATRSRPGLRSTARPRC